MFGLTIFQIIVIIIAVLSSTIVFMGYNTGKTPIRYFILWIVLWVTIVIASFLPEGILSLISTSFGFGRGLDFLLISAIIILFYLLFRVYLMIERIDQDITALVEKLAIDNENSKINNGENSNGTNKHLNNCNNISNKK